MHARPGQYAHGAVQRDGRHTLEASFRAVMPAVMRFGQAQTLGRLQAPLGSTPRSRTCVVGTCCRIYATKWRSLHTSNKTRLFYPSASVSAYALLKMPGSSSKPY